MQEAFSAFEENKKATAWANNYENGIITSIDLDILKIEPRTPLVGDWLKSGDLGFIFAGRGVGKSWLSMYLAKGLACKMDVGPWKTHAQARVLYLDGEMAPEDLNHRDRVLGPRTPHLAYVNHEILFERTGRVMNMADLDWQQGTLDFCLSQHFNVLIADNLSTLASGIDENKSLDWELILPWLLTLRRHHITAIIVHHAGRNNQMRGSSKREDPAFWILRLDSDSSLEDQIGASFISRFTKWRNASEFPCSYHWCFRPNGNNEVSIEFKQASPLYIFIQWVEDGLDTCSDIASEMGLSKGYISRLAKQALALGRIRLVGRRYETNG